MHMSDALLSPAVGGVFWAASAGLVAYSAKKIAAEDDDRSVPLMGVTGAFVFAAQMINFAIPGTGSSGHLGGGLLLSILLGPYRAFLVLASVLTVQALLFADGGLLALGCNVFNLAFFPAFIAYPFIWRRLAGPDRRGPRMAAASVVAAVAGLVMGAVAVVLQTVFSGISELTFGMFTTFMVPVHIAIGVVEGLVTWGVVGLVEQVEPGTLERTRTRSSIGRGVMVLAVLTLLVGGILSWFASSAPDGLEWSIGKVAGSAELEAPDAPVYHWLSSVQEKLSVLPDYGFRSSGETASDGELSPVSLGTSVSGIVGALLVLFVGAVLGLAVR
ncbi:MAG: cobalamin biosynthesis protein CbiM, partial [Chitinivibrionales bacterium]|nr:cobalamin biosynthesis protein CbiM [Chitinivibrionales bacterium]